MQATNRIKAIVKIQNWASVMRHRLGGGSGYPSGPKSGGGSTRRSCPDVFPSIATDFMDIELLLVQNPEYKSVADKRFVRNRTLGSKQSKLVSEFIALVSEMVVDKT